MGHPRLDASGTRFEAYIEGLVSDRPSGLPGFFGHPECRGNLQDPVLTELDQKPRRKSSTSCARAQRLQYQSMQGSAPKARFDRMGVQHEYEDAHALSPFVQTRLGVQPYVDRLLAADALVLVYPV
jgi:hypothetical protein